MSLINDALKRVQSQQQGESSSEPPPQIPPEIQSVEVPKRPKISQKFVIFSVVGVLILGLGAYFGAILWTKMRAKPVVVETETVADIAPMQKFIEETKTEPPPPAPPPPAAVTPPTPPDLKLEGIFIEGNLREAVINGQIVGIGDEIDGARVMRIEPNGVKLEFQGHAITLSLR
jgi:hypothetical protein